MLGIEILAALMTKICVVWIFLSALRTEFHRSEVTTSFCGHGWKGAGAGGFSVDLLSSSLPC
jgi:hypothetical protein